MPETHPRPHLPRRARSATPARSLPRVVGRFIETEVAGGVVLLVAAVVALVWANSPWDAAYRSFWHTPLELSAGPLRFQEDLGHFVNDALMAVFFFVVGLELKRELVRGELSNFRVAALPVFAAFGGMLVPIALFFVLAPDAPLRDGWGIPMATDIAFVLGVLAVFGSRVPPSLKLFALTLAVVDDLGAILVIAVFYGDGFQPTGLVVAVAALAATFALRQLRVDWVPAYLFLAIATWFGVYESGLHATIAGVALAFATPTVALAPGAIVRRWADRLADEPDAAEVQQMTILARESVSPAEFLEARLHPTVSFFILPVFALANAGVSFGGDLFDAASSRQAIVAIVGALVVGKLVGIAGGAWIGTRLGVASLPEDMRWRHVVGVAALGGVGFTVSLFVTGLAFESAELADAARVGVLAASVIAAVLGSIVLAVKPPADPVVT